MDVPTSYDQVLQRYESKYAAQQESVKQIGERWSRFAYLRGASFIASLVPLYLALIRLGGVSVPWLWLAGLIFVAFLVIAYMHERMQIHMRKATILSDMHRESVARVKRDWKGIRSREIEIPDAFGPVSFDLDLLGESSLFKLIGITRTPLGTQTLTDWIVEGAAPNEVKARQEAVAELAPALEWREKFRLNCEQLNASQSGPSRFVEWAESPNWFNKRRWILWFGRITALAIVLTIVLPMLGLLPLHISIPAFVVVFALNFLASVFFAGGMHDVFNMISSRRDEINFYVSLFDMTADFPAKSERLIEIKERMNAANNDARKQIDRLGLLVWLANLRRDGMAFLLYLALQFFFFWDVHILDQLEKWKEENGSKSRAWFDDLGQWEALCALAKLKADQPSWVFPDFKRMPTDEAAITCEQVAHPLLDASRVANDAQVGPAGTVLLVSGSNMSGKSTLLRSLGVNVVLAQMGSVVCAKEMSLPPIHIETSMRINDSLADGVSFFMAELKRLKQVVDQARDFKAKGEKTMMFLLDEILQGTNSRERQIAVSRVVRKLIDDDAIGAISTHDLDLAKTDDLQKACKCVHFSEHFKDVDGKRQMTFDYQMKQGIAETTNALKLLEMVGLGEDD